MHVNDLELALQASLTDFPVTWFLCWCLIQICTRISLSSTVLLRARGGAGNRGCLLQKFVDAAFERNQSTDTALSLLLQFQTIVQRDALLVSDGSCQLRVAVAYCSCACNNFLKYRRAISRVSTRSS